MGSGGVKRSGFVLAARFAWPASLTALSCLSDLPGFAPVARLGDLYPASKRPRFYPLGSGASTLLMTRVLAATRTLVKRDAQLFFLSPKSTG